MVVIGSAACIGGIFLGIFKELRGLYVCELGGVSSDSCWWEIGPWLEGKNDAVVARLPPSPSYSFDCKGFEAFCHLSMPAKLNACK